MTWVLVTGASARGGAAISRTLHASGLNVIAHHSQRSVEAAAALVDEFNGQRDGSAKLWGADLAQTVAVPEWLVALRPSHCICNASVYRPSGVDDVVRANEDIAVHVTSHAAILAKLRPGLRSVVAVADIHVERLAAWARPVTGLERLRAFLVASRSMLAVNPEFSRTCP